MKWHAFRLTALWCWHQLLTLGLAALVVVAVMVGVSRELLPLADQYRPRLEQALSQRLGVPVTLARVEGEADGIQLFLRLVQLDLRDPAARDRVLLRVPEVELRPQVWQSLWHRELRVDVRLHGLDLHFDQQPDGRLQLRELAGLARRDAATAEKTLGFVLRQPVLALSESRIAVSLNGLPGVSLRGVELVNRNDGDVHRLAGRALVPGAVEELQLQAAFAGDPLHWQRGHLQAWVRLPVLNLDGWLPLLAGPASAHGVRLERLRGGGQYWIDVSGGRLAGVQAEADWRELALVRDGQPRRFEHLRGQFTWRRNSGGWLLAAQGLRGRIDGEPWPLPALALRGGPGTLSLAARNTNVAGALRLLAGVPLPAALAEWLPAAQPVGEVEALRADLARRDDGGWRLRRLDVTGNGFGARAVANHPGVRNLGGWLRWTPDRAWAGLALRQGELAVPNFVHEPVPVFHLDGRLRMAREDGGWRVDSDRLQGANADLGASAVFSLSVPADPAQQPRLALVGRIDQAQVASAWRYLPWHAASEHAIEWVQRNLTAGVVPQGAIAYAGPLHPDPDLDPGHLQLRLQVRRASLDYAPGWPGLREVDADVLLDGARLAVTNASARLLDGTRASAVSAEIPALHEPVLAVSGTLASTGADLNRLFRDSPLAAHLPGIGDVLVLEGPVAGQLALTMPVHAEAVPDVNVVAQLRDNRLFLKPARLTASRLAGEVRYSTRDGLQSPGLDAELLEAPVHADIRTEAGDRPTTYVTVNGSAGVPALRRWLGATLLDMTSGSLGYQARVTLPAGAPARLQVDSPLAGLRVALPAPLGKAAAEVVPLRYQVGLGSGEQFGRLQYGQRLSGGVVWNGSRLDRALLRVDSTTPGWPQQSGLEIEGRVPRLDMAEWRPVVERLQRRDRAATVAARGESAMPDLSRLDLDVQELLVEGWRLRNGHLGLTRQPGAWRIALETDELDGEARLPDSAGSEIRIDFSRLQWPLPQQGPRATAAAGLNPVSGLGNRPLAVAGDGLRLGAWPGLGPLAVKARVQPLPAGLRVDDLAVHGALLDFKGQLDWLWRGGASTRVQGHASSGNVTGLLTAFGVTPPLVSRHAGADLDLSWPGGPDAASFGALDGHLHLMLEQGRLLNVSTGASASRIFGWFSLDNLQRRLKGDFADVTRRGLAFDSISLDGSLDAGVMPAAAVQMKGPTLQAQGQGRLDLGQRKVDQQFTVTMPMTSAVPIAAVALAGPVVGGAVAAAKMAFDKQIGRATELHYRVSGDWENPSIERLAGRNAPAPAPAAPAPAPAPRKAGVNIATKENR